MARSCKVAVIGAGVAGLLSARELSQEGHRVVVFEKSDRVGGQWLYDPRVETDPLGLDPSREIVHSSIYSSMRTNSPRPLMGFLDYPLRTRGRKDPRAFPGHREILSFVEEFARDYGLHDLIRFGTEVVRVAMGGSRDEWFVESRVADKNFEVVETFEAVVVCTGHFTQPQVPKIPGIDKWPGKQVHSHNYRVPEPFHGQVVVLIGNGPSAFDISRDVSKVAKEVHLASRSANKVEKLANQNNIWQHSMIKCVHEDGMVIFQDGSSLHGDVILYSTGYKYHYPFLEIDGIVSIDDNRVGPLYKHVFSPQLAPYLSFIGMVSKVILFLTMELQSKWVAQVLSEKIVLPTEEDMILSVEKYYEFMEETGIPKHYTHTIHPKEFEYMNWLADQVGLPPLEEWREEIHFAAIESVLSHRDGYRDEWDADYWSHRYPSILQRE